MVRDTSPAVVTVSATSDAAEAGSVPGTFTLTRSGTQQGDITIAFTFTGSATLTFAGTTGTNLLTIPADVSEASFSVVPTDDALIETPETLTLTLQESDGYTLGNDTTATISITDNDIPALFLSLNNNSLSEGDTATATLTLLDDSKKDAIRAPRASYMTLRYRAPM